MDCRYFYFTVEENKVNKTIATNLFENYAIFAFIRFSFWKNLELVVRFEICEIIELINSISSLCFTNFDFLKIKHRNEGFKFSKTNLTLLLNFLIFH